jgi:hypothetical protein
MKRMKDLDLGAQHGAGREIKLHPQLLDGTTVQMHLGVEASAA